SVANDTSGLVPQRQKASDYDNPGPAPDLQNVSPSADTTVPSQQELDLLFGHLLERIFKKKAKNDQAKHEMEKTKSNRSQSQSKSKVNQIKKIQPEGLKLPNLKLCCKKTRAEIEN
ncbi:hypothetical protein Tco_0218190, partial [Tanacetum coccineum]